MRQGRLSILALAAGIGFACAVHAAATQYSADAGEVRDIRLASGTGATAVLYAATQGGGVFKSTNGGSTWAKTGLNAGYAWKVVPSVISASNTAYAATENGLWKTTNGGTTWTQLTFDAARTVAVDPTSAGQDTILIGVRGLGVLRSTDSGATWTRQSTGLQASEPTHLVFSSGTSTAYVVLACNTEDVVPPFNRGNWGGVFRTLDAKAATVAWTDFTLGGGGAALSSTCIGAMDANATYVWVGVNDPFTSANGFLYRSSGTGWVKGSGSSPSTGNFFVGVTSIAVDRNAANTIHVGGGNTGVWTSSDNGLNFSQKSDPTPSRDPESWTRINAIESVPGLATTLLAGARGVGILRSTNTNLGATSITWSAAPGVTADRVRGLDNHASAAPTTYWMALEQGGVFKAANINAAAPWALFIAGMDLGATLGTVDTLLSATAIAADPNNANIVLVGTRGAGLLQLNGGGTSWTQSGLPLTVTVGNIDIQPEHLLIPSSGKVYYTLFNAPGGGKGGGLMQSTSGAAGLVNTNFPENNLTTCTATPPGAGAGGYKVVQTPTAVAYLLRYDGLPYRSTNTFTGPTATCVNVAHVGFDRIHFWGIAERPGNASMVVASTNKGVFRSTDGGLNFARVAVAGLTTQVLSDVAYANGNLYGVTRAGEAFCSTDDGTSWQAISLGGLPPASFRQIRVINGVPHVLTDGAGFYTLGTTCP